jgi:dTDP-4-dehydrorhamnose 3,5-epimerase
MKVRSTEIADVLLVQTDVLTDERGFFMESYHATKFAEAGINETFVQDNHSGSERGTLRGLHYQIRQAQGKLVRVISGEVYDVAVDLRRSSQTFGKWVGVTLSARNKDQLWVPKGFAHGFYVMSDWAEVIYKATDFYAAQWERSLLWNDPQIGISWPMIEGMPTLSEKDRNGKLLTEAEVFSDL